MMIKCKENVKGIWLLVVVLNISFVQLGCDVKKVVLRQKKYSETKMLMGTVVQMDVCRNQADISEIESAYNDIWERLETISWRMNVADESSDIAKINKSGLEAILIAPDTYHVLRESIDLARSTKGAFDITVKPLMNLWRKAERNNILPSETMVMKVQFLVDYEHIQLLGNHHVRLLKKWAKIDLGGIAKGYAVDEAARIFRKHGITSFFIDAGGDIYVGGKNCAGEPWRIGIRDPRDRSKTIDIVEVEDRAVVTSGDYEQHYLIEGQKWSHIINPLTGYPQKGVISATVIAPSAMEADALATALCVLGGGPGTKQINALKAPHASLIISKQKSCAIKKFESEEYKKYKYKR